MLILKKYKKLLMSSLGISFKLCILFIVSTINFTNAQIAKDKQLHFAAGMIASSTGYGYVWNRTKDKKKALIAGIGTAILAGTAKEILDSRQINNKFDVNDLAATTLGGITIGVTINLIKPKKYVGINKTVLQRRVDLLME